MKGEWLHTSVGKQTSGMWTWEVTTLCGTVVAQAQNLWLGVSVHKDLWLSLWLRVSVVLVTVACMWPGMRLGQRRSSWVFSFKKECVRFRAGTWNRSDFFDKKMQEVSGVVSQAISVR